MSKIDYEVIKTAYEFTVADDGEIYGLVAGDHGYEATGIAIPIDHLEAWAEYQVKDAITDFLKWTLTNHFV